jgi:membrane protein
VTGGDGPTHRRSRRAAEFAKGKYAGSLAEQLWAQLRAVDFIDRAVVFAATLLLSLLPFIIVASALAGKSVVRQLARHLGLNTPAAAAVCRLFASSAATSHAVSGTASAVLFVVGGIAAAAALQELYERMFGVDRRGFKDMHRQLTWLGALLGCSVLAGWANPHLLRVGGPILLGLIGFVFFIGFFWFSIWLLLAGRKSWRELFPAACASAVFWLGLHVVFSLFFSSLVVAQDKEYGPIGTVFALMTYLIGVGVVVILGAAVGIVWHDRAPHLPRALRKRRC